MISTILEVLSTGKVKLLIIAVLLAVSNYFTYSHTSEYVSNKYELQIASNNAKNLQDRIDKEAAIQESFELIKKSNDLDKDRIRSDYNRTINSLRLRATRAEQAAANASNTGPTCTGRELSREDAEFLTGEAARAEALRSDLNKCVSTYNEIRKLLSK